MGLTNEEKVSVIREHLADIERTIRYLVIHTQEELDARKEMGTEESIISFINEQQSKMLLLEEMIEDLTSGL